MTHLGTLAVRALVVLLAGLAVTAHVAHVDAVLLQGLAGRSLARNVTPAFVTLLLADALVSVVSGGLAVALAFRRDGRGGARGLAVALGAWSYLLAYAGAVRLMRPAGSGFAQVLFDGHYPFVETLGLAGIVHFTGAFPRKLVASDLPDARSLPPWARPFHWLRVGLLRPSGPWVAAAVVVTLVLALTRFQGRPLQDAGLSPAMDVARFGAVAVVVLNLRHSWMLADLALRRRMLWIAVGLALLFGCISVLVGGNVLLAVTRWPGPPFAWRHVLLDVGLVGLLVGLALSVFYSGRRDSARTLRRVTDVVVAATVALLLASGLEVLFSGALVSGASLPAGLGTVLAVSVVIALRRPLTGLVEGLFDQTLGARPEGDAAAG